MESAVYFGYIGFQITHPHVFDSKNVPKSTPYHDNTKNEEPIPIIQLQSMPQVEVEEPEKIESPQLNGWVNLALMVAIIAVSPVSDSP